MPVHYSLELIQKKNHLKSNITFAILYHCSHKKSILLKYPSLYLSMYVGVCVYVCKRKLLLYTALIIGFLFILNICLNIPYTAQKDTSFSNLKTLNSYKE